MFSLLCKTLRRSASDVQSSSFFLESVSFFLLRGLSTSPSKKKIKKAADQQKQKCSVAVSYLVNRRGSPPKTAISAFRKVHSESPVLGFLKNHGFSDAQIAKLIRELPKLVSCDPNETLLRIIEFFKSIGITGSDFTRILTQNPKIWFRSIDKGLAPCYDFIRSVVSSEDKAIASLKRAPWMFMRDTQTSIAPKIASLRNFGVAQPVVSFLVSSYPNLLLRTKANFEKHVGKVLEMGFNPKNSEFVHALKMFSGMTELTRDRKKAVFGRFGWSEDEILAALKTSPMCLMLSEKKIQDGLDFLMNEMGWGREAVARIPIVLCYSLKKRVIPRCSVVQVLQSEGLLNEEDIYLSSVLIPPEKVFLARFVIKYEEQAPHLLNVYNGKLGKDCSISMTAAVQ